MVKGRHAHDCYFVTFSNGLKVEWEGTKWCGATSPGVLAFTMRKMQLIIAIDASEHPFHGFIGGISIIMCLLFGRNIGRGDSLAAHSIYVLSTFSTSPIYVFDDDLTWWSRRLLDFLLFIKTTERV